MQADLPSLSGLAAATASSITYTEGLHMPFAPKEPERAQALVGALSDGDLSFAKLGICAMLRGTRLGFGQQAVEPLKDPASSYIGIPFTTGVNNWFFLYGADASAQNGFLVVVFAIPTTVLDQASGGAQEVQTKTLFQVTGYSLVDGQSRPFSAPGQPLFCPGSYEESGGSVTLELAPTEGGKAGLVALSWKSSATSYVVKATFADGAGDFSCRLNAVTKPRMEGDASGCSPCISGVGTTYISNPRLEGTFSSKLGGTTGIIGWWDRQGGNFSLSLRSWLLRLFSTLKYSVTPQPEAPRWFWFTVQPQDPAKGSLTGAAVITGQPAPASFPSPTYPGTASLFLPDGSNSYGIKVHVTALRAASYDAALASQLRIDVEEPLPDGWEVASIILDAQSTDGRVTVGYGTVNQEAPAVAKDASSGKVLGLGFVEAMGMHSSESTLRSALERIGVASSYDSFAPGRKLPFSQTWSTWVLAAGLPVIVLLLVLLLVFTSKRKPEFGNGLLSA